MIQIQPIKRLRTFNAAVPPEIEAVETFWSCFILSEKSVIHWITVQPEGTV